MEYQCYCFFCIHRVEFISLILIFFLYLALLFDYLSRHLTIVWRHSSKFGLLWRPQRCCPSSPRGWCFHQPTRRGKNILYVYHCAYAMHDYIQYNILSNNQISKMHHLLIIPRSLELSEESFVEILKMCVYEQFEILIIINI